MPKYYWEDFAVDSVEDYGPKLVTREEIIAFASQFDPQPMHLDEEAARATMLGGLAASGWHSCAMLMRMMCDWFVLDSASWGGPGVEEVRWLKPVRAGDRLMLRRKILEKRISKSRPEMGFVKFHYTFINQDGEAAMTLVTPMMVGLRAAAQSAGAGAR
jgi:acyl dehydratase